MLLQEHEAKQLLIKAGLHVPASTVVTENVAGLQENLLNSDVFMKAQVLHGNRAESGLIQKVSVDTKNDTQMLSSIQLTTENLLQKQDQFGQPISSVLIEQAQPFTNEWYVAIRYDTASRKIICLYSEQGGTGMDERGDTLKKIPLSALTKPTQFEPNPDLLECIQKLWQVFIENDATLVEINPLVQKTTSASSATAHPQFVCLDAKIELDDSAAYRHSEWSEYPDRSAFGRPPTSLEQQALAVSRSDHRGVAGESFFEIDPPANYQNQPRIGIMASGGGASTLIMDALMSAGVLPANYTEYSGNPTREKVAKLAKVVLSIPNLSGLFVVGSNANFTDIYETLAGVVDGFLESAYAAADTDSTSVQKDSPNNQDQPFVILIRRGGPRWEEGFEMVRDRLQPLIDSGKVKLQLNGPEYPLLQTAYDMKELLLT